MESVLSLLEPDQPVAQQAVQVEPSQPTPTQPLGRGFRKRESSRPVATDLDPTKVAPISDPVPTDSVHIDPVLTDPLPVPVTIADSERAPIADPEEHTASADTLVITKEKSQVHVEQSDPIGVANEPKFEEPKVESKFVTWKPKHTYEEGLIFVAIAAYRDTELIPTIKNMLANAKYSDKLRFGICLQDTVQGLNDFPWYGDRRFRVLRVPAEQSKGCCWARHQMQFLYQGEDYYLQLDSHHRFVRGWDERCIWMLHHCNSAKPILSTYLPPYTPETEKQDVVIDDLYTIAITGYDKKGLITFRPQLITDDELPLLEPRPAFMIAGGFIFTFAEWMREIPYDPSLYFNGEEISLTVRSWTHGWDIFCPNMVVSFHYYQRAEEPKHWKDHDDWRSSNKNSIDQVLQQLHGNSSGKYGLGSMRTLEQFQVFAGVDFQQQTAANASKRGIVSKRILNGSTPPMAPSCYAELVARAPPTQLRTARPRPAPAFMPTQQVVKQQPPQRQVQPTPLGQPAVKTPLRPQQPQQPQQRFQPQKLTQPSTGVAARSMVPQVRAITTNPSKQSPLVKNLFPAPNPKGMRRIEYTGGYLVKDSNDMWHEYKGTQRFASFQQRRGADDDFVYLFDSGRELNLRIDGKGHCQFLQGQIRPDSVWRTNFRGEWQ